MPNQIPPRERILVALDFPTATTALQLVDQLDGRCAWFKVGLELYLAAGPAIVETLRHRGFQVFVDLKLHDIPNTVAGAIRSLSATGASLLTVHAAGGQPMLEAAAAQVTAPGSPRLLAVTVLTSMNAADLSAIGVLGTPAEQVLRLGRLAARSGITGLVCSPEETAALRHALPPETLLVVPGIRPAGAALGDQSRVATPAAALAGGASLLVIGRPITQAADPAKAFETIVRQLEHSLEQNPKA